MENNTVVGKKTKMLFESTAGWWLAIDNLALEIAMS